MAEMTTFLNIPYPTEDDDPWFEGFVAMMREIDQLHTQSKLQNNLFVAGGGTIAFNSGTNTLTWTSDFVIPIFHYGFKLNVQFGPDETNRTATVLDGSALVVDIPYAMLQNENTNLNILTQLTPANHAQFVIGWRYGNKVYIRNLGEF